jgi:hypothetical protein
MWMEQDSFMSLRVILIVCLAVIGRNMKRKPMTTRSAPIRREFKMEPARLFDASGGHDSISNRPRRFI